jgi:tetratricopeptide (TPR) repeat protein
MLNNANELYGGSNDFLRQANYLTKLGDMDQAKVAYQKAIHFAAQDDAEPWIAMAAFYELVGDKGNAIEALRHAHAINPANLSVADRLRHYGIVPGPAAGIQPTPNVMPLPQVESITTETAPAQ